MHCKLYGGKVKVALELIAIFVYMNVLAHSTGRTEMNITEKHNRACKRASIEPFNLKSSVVNESDPFESNFIRHFHEALDPQVSW